MRRYVQKQLLELAGAVSDGVRSAESSGLNECDAAVLMDCHAGINTMDKALSAALSHDRFMEYKELLDYVKELLELLYKETHKTMGEVVLEPAYNVNAVLDALYDNLSVLYKELENESEVKLEIVFMPYKASMWDCFDSIWRAASKDKQCNVSVVPIPYYDKGSNGELCNYYYEGESLPGYVKIIHYQAYSMQIHKPDAVYIHNPYDGCNYVTSVAPEYYSKELRKHTDRLIYVPYFIAGCYLDIQSALPYVAPMVIINSHYIVYQSPVQLEMLKEMGLYQNNALVLGNPKLDYYADLKDPGMPNQAWEKCQRLKKTVLFTTTLDLLLSQSTTDDPFAWLRYTLMFMNSILQFADIAMIWRPHPLTRQTIHSMRPYLTEAYECLESDVLSHSNCVLDEQADSRYAIYYSDALISDGGSMSMQYMATEKPVLNIYSSRCSAYTAFDMGGAYFADQMVYPSDEFSKLSTEEKQKSRSEGIHRFCEMVLCGQDPKKETRLAVMRRSVVNSDGTAGEKIHQCIAAGLLGAVNSN